VQLHRYFVSQSSQFYGHNPSCCFSTSVYCSSRLFRYDSVRKLLDTPSYLVFSTFTSIPTPLLESIRISVFLFMVFSSFPTVLTPSAQANSRCVPSLWNWRVAPYVSVRYRVRCRTDSFLRGLLLQRHHRVGFEVLLRLVHESPALDNVWQLLEHPTLQTGESLYSTMGGMVVDFL
jgi:hypothetical protein